MAIQMQRLRVCKYALKFGDLSVENTWEAFKVLKGKHLSGAFGSLWGVKVPENLADDMPDEKRPAVFRNAL